MKTIGCFLIFILLLSCNKKVFVNRENVICKKKGLMVFIHNESRKFRNTNGDVFVDSLIGDFFIPFNFSQSAKISEKDVKNAFRHKKNQKMFFFYIKDDCKTGEKKVATSLSREITVDKNVDSYLYSNKLSILPVEIQYLKVKNPGGNEYYQIHKKDNFQIYFEGQELKFILQPDYYDVLTFSILNIDWAK